MQFVCDDGDHEFKEVDDALFVCSKCNQQMMDVMTWLDQYETH